MKDETGPWLRYAEENLQAAQRIHSINMLAGILAERGITIHLTEAECDLLDAVYVPSKYPLGSALPDFAPDAATCNQCLEIAERVSELVRQHLGT